jgi:MoaA/NifB/PqqE/SkfB family radical SAM enzyme
VTNNTCNLNCRYCYGGYGNRKGYRDYSTKELLKIIDELKELGTQLITLHGGESLLRKDIGELINYAKHKGFYISFNTNGYLVSAKISEIKCVDTVVLSLDGLEESNDKNRGKGCYEKVMEAIDIVKQNHLPLVISATLTRDNMHDMRALAELGHLKNIRIQYSILYNHEVLKDRCAEIVMSDAEIRQTVQEIWNLKKQGYPIYYSENVLEVTIHWPFSYEKRYITQDDAYSLKKAIFLPCYHGRLKYQIDADGRVVTCWAHDIVNAPNIREFGVGGAIKRCRDANTCKYCAFLANNEHNALMHLSPKSIWNILCIHLADVLKIKSSK